MVDTAEPRISYLSIKTEVGLPGPLSLSIIINILRMKLIMNSRC